MNPLRLHPSRTTFLSSHSVPRVEFGLDTKQVRLSRQTTNFLQALISSQLFSKTRKNGMKVTAALKDIEKSSRRVETTSVPISDLRQLVQTCVEAEGHPLEDAELIADVLLWAQLRGNNQSATKIPAGAVKRPDEVSPLQEILTGPSTVLLKGNQNYGMVVLMEATTKAISKAQQSGIGIVGTYETSSSTGALGYYAEKIAKQGYIGIVISQSPEFVAPEGSSEAIFGTNPLAIGIPVQEGKNPILFDMSTAAMAWYGLLEAKLAGEEVAEDVGFDANGQVTTDPARILDGGAIRSFTRDHKGGGLAFVLELLAGALPGGAMQDKRAAANWGNLVLAVDPAIFGNSQDFCERVGQAIARVKGARRESPDRDILIPGERGYFTSSRNEATGLVPISKSLLEQLKEAAEKPAKQGPSPAATTRVQNGSGAAESTAARTSLEASPPVASSTPELTAAKIEAQDDFRAPPNPQSGLLGVRLSTLLVHPSKSFEDPYGASASPLYQTATFAQVSATECGPYDYTRSGNPTRTQLETEIASLEAATRAFAFASGMAALSAVLRVASFGDHILAGDDLYGGTNRLLAQVAPNLGLDVTHVDTSDIAAVKAAVRPGKTKLVMLESPTNPRMQICDLKTLTSIAHDVGAIVVADNSIMAFLYQRPLDLGVDISMTSATKFVGGHSDVTAGLLSVKSEALAQRIYFHQNAEGTALGPFDCWLLLRGLKTMDLRMERQVANCSRLAAFLQSHPLVKKVNYPGSAQHPGNAIHRSQARNGGSLLSFETGSLEASKVIVERTKLFKVTVSFGSVVSLISLPCFMSHASIPADIRAARGLPDDLIRISAGIENIDDLIADLEQALAQASDVVANV